MQLVTADELPDWYITQPYVKGGYRQCCSFRECSASVFRRHNETVSIWLHLPVSLGLIPYILWKMPPEPDNFMVYVSVIIGNVQILLTSAICHTYFCQSRTIHNACWFADFVGMLTGILAGGVGFTYYAFGLNMSIGGMAILYPFLLWITWRRFTGHVKTLPLTPREGFPEFVAPLAMFVAVCWAIPLGVAKLTMTEYTDDSEFVRAWNLSTACLGILMLGGLFQATNFPERFTSTPLGHSHQWWHACCSVLTFVWVEAITTHYSARSRSVCI